jgi:hypothetical protein
MYLAPLVQAQNQIPFQEDFQSGSLCQWTGKSGGAHDGQIVPDPLDCTGTNLVLNFTATNYGGDIFTALPVSLCCVTGNLVLSFDYLGLANGDPTPKDLGGFLGICTDLAPASEGVDHFWIAGTDPGAITHVPFFTSIVLPDDGAWHHYDLDITSIITNTGISFIYIMMEQWSGTGGLPGHVYFDNIVLQAITCP